MSNCGLLFIDLEFFPHPGLSFLIYILTWVLYIVIYSFEDNNSEFFHISKFFISFVDKLWNNETVSCMITSFFIFLYFIWYICYDDLFSNVNFNIFSVTFILFYAHPRGDHLSLGIMFPSVILMKKFGWSSSNDFSVGGFTCNMLRFWYRVLARTNVVYKSFQVKGVNIYMVTWRKRKREKSYEKESILVKNGRDSKSCWRGSYVWKNEIFLIGKREGTIMKVFSNEIEPKSQCIKPKM